MRIAILLAFSTLLLAGTAFAANDVLQLKSGKIAVGDIVAVDDKGVTLKAEAGEARYDWAALTPLCQYEIRADRLEPSDAKGRLELAEFCLGQGLYPHARREVATAQGLGHPEGKRLRELALAVDQAEADEAFARISQLMQQEDYEEALAEVRRYIIQAPESAHTKKARAMVPDLLQRMDGLRIREEEEAKEAKESQRSAALAARIEKLIAEAAKARAQADKDYTEAVRYHQIGNVTRAKKGYTATEKSLIKGHRALGKLQRLTRGGVAYDKAAKDKDLIRKRLVDVYVGLARLFLDDRNYKSGVVYVNKALYLDPVNREALELRSDVDENRIRRRASSITNTVPGRGK